VFKHIPNASGAVAGHPLRSAGWLGFFRRARSPARPQTSTEIQS